MNDFDKKIKTLTLEYLNIPENFDIEIDRTLSQINEKYTKKSNDTKLIKLKKIWLSIISFLLASISIVSMATYIKGKFESKNIEYIKDIESNVISNIKMENYKNFKGLSYKVIDNLETYNKFTKLYKNFNYKETINFETDFLVIVEFNYGIIDGIDVIDVTSDDKTTYIVFGNQSLKPSKKIDNKFCILISNEYKRDNIEFEVIPGTIDIEKFGYTSMNKITQDYRNENAFKENCFILDSFGNIKSNDKKQLEEFIENCKIVNSSAIRIIKDCSEIDEEYLFKVIDIIYENESFYMFSTQLKKDNIGNIYDNLMYIKGIKKINITKSDDSNLNSVGAILMDHDGNETINTFLFFVNS